MTPSCDVMTPSRSTSVNWCWISCVHPLQRAVNVKENKKPLSALDLAVLAHSVCLYVIMSLPEEKHQTVSHVFVLPVSKVGRRMVGVWFVGSPDTVETHSSFTANKRNWAEKVQ